MAGPLLLLLLLLALKLLLLLLRAVGKRVKLACGSGEGWGEGTACWAGPLPAVFNWRICNCLSSTRSAPWRRTRQNR